MVARIISGDRVLEPAELDRQVDRAAAALRAEGVGEGDVIALLLRNDFAFLVASLAAVHVGAYATPINWHGTFDEIEFVLRDSRAKILIAHDDLLGCFARRPLDIPVVAVPTPAEIRAAYRLPESTMPLWARSWDAWLSTDRPSGLRATSAPMAAMVYTSGTTGRPKGVRRAPSSTSDKAPLQRLMAEGFGFVPMDGMVVVMTGPLYHSAPNAYGMAAIALADLIILQPRFDAENLLELVARHQVTHMHLVPTMFVRLLKLDQVTRERHDVSSLRCAVHGAAPCPPLVKKQMIDWWGPVVHEYYGSTETGLITGHGSAEALARPGTAGRALTGVDLAIFDDEGLKLSSGEIGGVYIRANAMPDFTYEGRETERSAIELNGMVTVGDIGWLDADGYLFLCDRKRDMIITGGVNVYPAEIEAELMALDGIRDCAVFGIPDEEFGEAVCAHIELEPGADPDAGKVRAALAKKLARFKVPKVVEFASALPREDSGKIFKRRLREPYWESVGRSI